MRYREVIFDIIPALWLGDTPPERGGFATAVIFRHASLKNDTVMDYVPG
jgi:hypothetical protein